MLHFQTLALLEEEEDINQVTEYFSYEHFYVIYCKFWELDKDHDLFIDKADLARHNDHGMVSLFLVMIIMQSSIFYIKWSAELFAIMLATPTHTYTYDTRRQ